MSPESLSSVCAKIKDLGYAPSKHVRMYGQEFTIVSDPFPDGKGIAVYATAKNDSTIQTLRLPLLMLRGLEDPLSKPPRAA